MVLYFYELCCSNCSRILAVLRASPFHIDPKRIRVQIFTNPFSLATFSDVYLHIYIFKTQIHVRPQIRVLSSNLCLSTNRCPIKLLYPQIRVLLPCRSLSFGIASHSNLCPPKSIFLQICVLLWKSCQRMNLRDVGSETSANDSVQTNKNDK
jgi:hypothetical protein